MRMFGQKDVSAFGTIDHDIHRQRREIWNSYFSKQSVARLQPRLVQASVNKLCTKIEEYQKARIPVTMVYAFSCLTFDIISEYTFPEGFKTLDRPRFDSAHYEACMAMSSLSHSLKQFGWLLPLIKSTPMWITKWTNSGLYLMMQTQKALLERAIQISEERGKPDSKAKSTGPSMLEAFMDSSTLPESEKTLVRIKAEAQTAVAAGTLTTTHALKAATYHILANDEIHSHLMAELEQRIPDPNKPPTLRELEQMPYLQAVMHETLRVFYGVSHRLQRIFPHRIVQYKDIAIPPGTPISMTSVHMHDNERYFPNHYKFDPSRWQVPNPPYKYIATFGKGSRMCVGMELAKAEILTTLANMFRRFGREMELFETERERDIDTVYDVFNPLPSRESNGLMVMFRQKEG
ncbi:MAG: hypothetical protein Q9169_005277 [Polycauliona sp. 2 TL-2023]